jgi:hypothetical protein
MRLECTPDLQHHHNDFVHKKLRGLMAAAVLIVVGAVGLEAALILMPAAAPPSPTVIGSDGKTVIGAAVAVTAEYVLVDGDVPPGSQLSTNGTDRFPLERIRTEDVSGAKLMLLHLQTPLPREVPALRMPQNGEQASASVSVGHWEGTLVERSKEGGLEAQPSIAIGSVAPLIATLDHQLVGISAPGSAGDVAVSARALLAKFPELKK